MLLLRKGLCGEDRRSLTGLDLWSRPTEWPLDWAWLQQDLLQYDGYGQRTVLLANMILHQFKTVELQAVGSRIGSSVRLILASETSRRRIHLAQLRLAPLIGINHVTKHDARVSVKAGFVGEELPEALGLDPEMWNWSCNSGAVGQYRMIAIRRGVRSSH